MCSSIPLLSFDFESEHLTKHELTILVAVRKILVCGIFIVLNTDYFDYLNYVCIICLTLAETPRLL